MTDQTTPPTSDTPIDKPETPRITIEDFFKVQLRVAKILHVEPVPKSKKLLKLDVEISGEKRQILSGISQYYQPEDLVGKHVVVVANLQTAKLMGHESQGMILAVMTENEEKLSVIEVPESFPSGSEVR